MSIVTKTGDDGTTGLMYGRRVKKTDLQVEVYGSVDELSANLGLARAYLTEESEIKKLVLEIQRELVLVMGEFATAGEDQERYRKDGYKTVSAEMISRLEEWVKKLELDKTPRGWSMAGENLVSAAFHLARTACRRAERKAWHLHETSGPINHDLLIYLNRLSDLLWLLAREVERPPLSNRLQTA